MTSKLTQFVNCNILRNHRIVKEDIWVRNGKIVDPEKIFFDEKIKADAVIDCKGYVVAPGFIELQINGGYGYDFSFRDRTDEGVDLISKKLLSHGVTSYCPTLVTSPPEVYHKILPKIKRRKGGIDGATILGVHVEGPFINKEKKGAHPPECIVSYQEGISAIEEVYGSLENVQLITLAPEFKNSDEVIKGLTKKGIVVSLGHSTANLAQGEEAVNNGATFITHLFNAMLPFHHRDPGLVGLLASDNIPKNKTVYFGIIADGTHTHPAALRIAYRVHPKAYRHDLFTENIFKKVVLIPEIPEVAINSLMLNGMVGLVLVTDAISAQGLNEGQHTIGQMDVEIRNKKAYVAGTDTLCGSIATMIECVELFMKSTGCSPEYALEAASLHPAQALGIDKVKGTLDFGADADFVMLTERLELKSTWIAGERVYES